MLTPSYSRISVFLLIASLFRSFYDPQQQRGEVPVPREQRKLAAIVAADVVGCSRLMGRDESGTLARLREHRKERLEPALARYGGRLVKLTAMALWSISQAR